MPASVRRDRVTAAGYAWYATWGWFLYGFGPAVPLLRAEQHTTRSVAALHSAALAAGTVLGALLTVAMLRRFRRGGTLQVAMGLVAAGVLVMVSGRRTPVTVTGALVAGTGGCLALNAVTVILSGHHPRTSAAVLSEGNAGAALSGLLAPLALGAGVALGLTWRAAILLTVPLVAASWVVLRRAPQVPALSGGPPAASGRARPLSPAFWTVLTAVVCCVAVEFCMGTWTPDLLRERVGASAALASSGVSAVVAGMAVGRLALGALARRHLPAVLLLAAIAVCALGWLVAWTARGVLAAMVGLCVTGLGIAAHYPVGVSLLVAVSDHQPDRAVAVLSFGIGFASGGGPFLLGALADRYGTHAAFLAVPSLLVGAAVAVLVSARFRRSPAPTSGAVPVAAADDDSPE